MARHCENAETLAAFLEDQPEITDVRYPGLASHEGHDTATRLYNGQYGALLTFDAQNREYAFEILRHLQLTRLLANIGDVHTLAIHPASTIYLNHSEQQRRQMGVTPGLVRVSVGLEDSRDIVADFKQALEIATHNKQQ
jgi:O-acetylhomoserine (thiol)-lyase